MSRDEDELYESVVRSTICPRDLRFSCRPFEVEPRNSNNDWNQDEMERRVQDPGVTMEKEDSLEDDHGGRGQ